MKRWQSTFVLCALVIACVMPCGCSSDGLPLAEVSGTVTLDGKPVPNALVTFNPVAEGFSYSLGKTDVQGNYRLEFTQDKRGALVGEHIIEITTKRISPDELPDTGEPVPSEFVAIPSKYHKRGELKATVSATHNDINFELTSQ